MLLLTSTNDIIQVITGTTGSAIHVHASWIDNVSGVITPGRTNTASIVTNTTTTVVAGPGSGQRNVVHLSITNAHASVNTDVTVEHFDNTTSEPLIKVMLAAGESLIYDNSGLWTHHNAANGAPYAQLGSIATQAEMETGTSLITVVSPVRVQNHPAVAKFHCKADTAGGALGTAWNVTSIGDTATGRMTVTIATDFSTADYACMVSVERTSTTATAASQRICNLENAGMAAGTVIVECHDGAATTAVIADPTAWHVVGFGDQ